MSALLDSLKAGFDALPATPDRAARSAAMTTALADGLPQARSERWKYTSLRALAARRFALATPLSLKDSAALGSIPAPRLVFVNGHFDATLSQLEALPAGIRLQALSLAGNNIAESAHHYEHGDEVFAKLNQALASDGARLQVDAQTGCEAVLHLVFVGVPVAGHEVANHDLDSHAVASHSHHRLTLGANTRATVVEHHLATGEHRHLHNHLFEIVLADGAHLQHARVQQEAIGASLITRTDATLGAGAHYQRVDLELGASLSRHELNVRLLGDGARLSSGGALLADGRRHLDTRLGIAHAGRDTACHLLWRGLADERGRVAFHGGILIEAGADGSDAVLSNKNLLLSDSAEIDSQPVLEIHADEVKAAHGATIGQLDATALFYLRSRGIALAQARSLLIAGFLREPLDVLASPALESQLAERLSANLLSADLQGGATGP